MGAHNSKNWNQVPLGFYLSRARPINDPAQLELELALGSNSNHLVPLTFNDLPSLSNLAMCSYNLVQLTPHLGQLKSMISIQLCCNQLKSLPREIGYLRNLTILDLSKNALTSLPDTIGCLEKLVDLKLCHNRLTELPTSIGMLKKLTSLVASHNRIKFLPRELGGLRALTTLDVGHNPISTLPAEIGQLAFLRRLKLDACPLLSEDEVNKMAFHHAQEPRVPLLSMKELAARAVVSSQIQVPLHHLPPRITHYIRSVHHCSFCQRPYFGPGVVRHRLIEKSDTKIPLEYRLCSPHWMDDTERVGLLFCAPEHPTHRRHFSTSVTPSSSSLSPSRAILSRFSHNLRGSPPPLPVNHPSVPSLQHALDKTPRLPSLPDTTSGTPRHLHRRSFILNRRSLSIHVP